MDSDKDNSYPPTAVLGSGCDVRLNHLNDVDNIQSHTWGSSSNEQTGDFKTTNTTASEARSEEPAIQWSGLHSMIKLILTRTNLYGDIMRDCSYFNHKRFVRGKIAKYSKGHFIRHVKDKLQHTPNKRGLAKLAMIFFGTNANDDPDTDAYSSWNDHHRRNKNTMELAYLLAQAWSLPYRNLRKTFENPRLEKFLSVVPVLLRSQDMSTSDKPALSSDLSAHASTEWVRDTFHDTIVGWKMEDKDDQDDEEDGPSSLISPTWDDPTASSSDEAPRADNPVEWNPKAYFQKHVRASSLAMADHQMLHTEDRESPNYLYCSLCSGTRCSYGLWSAAASIAAVTAAYTMNNYTLQRHDLDQSKHPPHAGFEALIMQPSPEIFVATSIIHGISTYAYYETRSKDRFRECFLAFGAASGSAGVLLAGVSVQDLLSGFLPGILVLSLLLCTGVSILWNCCARNRSSSKGKAWSGEAV